MNYRHGFHAGNFADLIKHAAMLLILDRLTRLTDPLLVVDSHAGAGSYDLGGEMARKSGEAEAGVARLMADPAAPAAFDGLKAAVRAANPKGGLTIYPGSPVLVAGRLRAGDAYVGAELHADDCAALKTSLLPWGGRAQGVQADGFDLVQARTGDARRLFVVIDPPFERPDDYARIIQAVDGLLARPRPTAVLIWLPLKDLETFDGFLRRLEGLARPSTLVLEVRLHPLTDPMRMNGCALVMMGAPDGLEDDLQAAADWVVRLSGGPGGLAKLWRPEG
jgi:23S rRNA (adenine2030-N6)-methyltransferase